MGWSHRADPMPNPRQPFPARTNQLIRTGDTTMTANATSNGRQRKTLATQLDRLDGILDGLSEGLNEAVATAVKDAVGLAVLQAVQGVLTELVTNPDLVQRLRGGPPDVAPPLPSRPTLRDRLGAVQAALAGGW